MNYEQDLEIDPTALDVEWLGQAKRFMHYAKLSAQADRKVRLAEENVKTVRSELVRKVQEDPDLLGDEIKLTAQTTEAYYRLHPKYKKAKKELIKLQFRANILTQAVSAFRQRRSSLENLVTLHGQQYFASPKEPRNLEGEHLKRLKKDQARDKVKRHLDKPRRTK